MHPRKEIIKEEKVTETQVVIIGGGIVGTAVARELSKYKVDVCLVEKEPGIGFGITKGSLGLLHSILGLNTSRLVKWWDRSGDLKAYLSKPLRNKEKFNIIGWEMFNELAPILNAKILRIGRIMLAENQEDLKVLEVVKEVAEGNGFKDLILLDKRRLQEKEPALDPRFIAGLYDPNEHSVFPVEWALAFAENAKDNGAHILLETEVRGIEEKNGYFLIRTNRGSIKAEFVINAAGLFSDEIASMVGKIDWSFILWKSQLIILENRGYLNNTISEVIKPQLPRVLVPTPEGNIEAGVIMSQSTNKFDFSTTKEGLNLLTTYPQLYIPSISTKRDIITSFVGYMHFNTRDPDDYLIEWPREKFLNLIVCAPAIAPAPAIAQEVVRMLINRGLNLIEKSDFNPYRFKEPRFSELPSELKNKKIRDDSKYGRIICRCNKISEQEVRDAIRKGYKTLDEIKFETWVGMGKCQGNFCTASALKIISEELGISPLEITKKGGSSYILSHNV